MKPQLLVSMAACLLLSFLVFTRTTLSSQSSDIKIRGTITPSLPIEDNIQNASSIDVHLSLIHI